jgi:hypothetical protein
MATGGCVVPRFIYNDLGGGLNQGQPPQTIQDREWIECKNFYPFSTKLRRRGGLRRLNDAAYSERVTGVLAFRPTTGSVQTLLGTRTGVAKLDGSTIVALPPLSGFTIDNSLKPWTLFEYKNIAYGLREGSGLVRSDGTYFGPSGIDAPGTAPTLAAGAGGDIPAADFLGVVTFYNPLTDVESNPSPASAVYTHTGSKKINWSGISVSTNAQVGARRLYRTLPNQTGEYYFVAQIDNNVDTTFVGDNVLVQDLGEAVSFSNGTPPVGLHFGTVWKERFFASDKVDVFPSELGRIENYDEDGIISVFPDDGHEIRAVYAYGDRLIIGKTNKVHYLVGTDPDNFGLLTLSDRHGCASHHSMQSAEGLLFWLGLDNFYRSDGNSVVGIASVKLQAILAALDPTTLEFATATVFPGLNWYVCVIPGVATVVYNYKTDAWAEFTHEAALQGVFDHFTDDFVQDLYAVDDAGYVYRFADETYNYDDNGATTGGAVTATLVSKPQEAGNPGAYAVMSRVYLAAQAYAEEIVLSWLHEAAVLNSRAVSLNYPERWKVYALSTRQGAKADVRFKIAYSGATRIELEGWAVDADSVGRLSTRPH